MTSPTLHFLPDHHDLPNLADELVGRLENAGVSIRRRTPFVPNPLEVDDEGNYTGNLPYEVVASSWHWLDDFGPLTRQKFLGTLEGALCEMTDRFARSGGLTPWPMTNKPATTFGRAYHDYRNIQPNAPVDVRIIIEYKSIEVDQKMYSQLTEPDLRHGLQFHLVTLVERGSYVD
jgi:hypothetical protein